MRLGSCTSFIHFLGKEIVVSIKPFSKGLSSLHVIFWYPFPMSLYFHSIIWVIIQQIQYSAPERYKTNAHCKSLSETFPAKSGRSCVALFWLLSQCKVEG